MHATNAFHELLLAFKLNLKDSFLFQKEQNEQYMSLKRLTENYWNDRYPVTKQLTASGFGPDRCRKYLEDEFTKISLNGEKPE